MCPNRNTRFNLINPEKIHFNKFDSRVNRQLNCIKSVWRLRNGSPFKSDTDNNATNHTKRARMKLRTTTP